MPLWARASAAAAALALAVARPWPAAAPDYRWSAYLEGLDASSLSATDLGRLATAFGAEAAAAVTEALNESGAAIIDLDGRPGRMTIARPGEAPPRWRGVGYAALPCRDRACGGRGLPSHSMAQPGYAKQWGASGRDDLGVIASLGANAVRLYHAFGLNASAGHARFLDRAAELGLGAVLGVHSDLAISVDECPDFDCFETWKVATLRGIRAGLAVVNESWHPAVDMVVLLNEPDYFELAPRCSPKGAWCRLKPLLSALDGFLAAEREAGVAPGRVRLSVTWSFAHRTSIDRRVSGPGIFGFQDVLVGIGDPGVVGYQPRMPLPDLREAFRTRWVHGLNSPAGWADVKELVTREYYRFRPVPWFLGEYGAFGMSASDMRKDLEAMDDDSRRDGSGFVGVVVREFQAAYEKGGTVMNFGLFGLGEEVIAETEPVCDWRTPCQRWPLRCLTHEGLGAGASVGSRHSQRATAVSAAWEGSLDGLSALCGAPRPTTTTATSSSKAETSATVTSADVASSEAPPETPRPYTSLRASQSTTTRGQRGSTSTSPPGHTTTAEPRGQASSSGAFGSTEAAAHARLAAGTTTPTSTVTSTTSTRSTTTTATTAADASPANGTAQDSDQPDDSNSTSDALDSSSRSLRVEADAALDATAVRYDRRLEGRTQLDCVVALPPVAAARPPVVAEALEGKAFTQRLAAVAIAALGRSVVGPLRLEAVRLVVAGTGVDAYIARDVGPPARPTTAVAPQGLGVVPWWGWAIVGGAGGLLVAWRAAVALFGAAARGGRRTRPSGPRDEACCQAGFVEKDCSPRAPCDGGGRGIVDAAGVGSEAPPPSEGHGADPESDGIGKVALDVEEWALDGWAPEHLGAPQQRVGDGSDGGDSMVPQLSRPESRGLGRPGEFEGDVADVDGTSWAQDPCEVRMQARCVARPAVRLRIDL